MALDARVKRSHCIDEQVRLGGEGISRRLAPHDRRLIGEVELSWQSGRKALALDHRRIDPSAACRGERSLDACRCQDGAIAKAYAIELIGGVAHEVILNSHQIGSAEHLLERAGNSDRDHQVVVVASKKNLAAADSGGDLQGVDFADARIGGADRVRVRPAPEKV